MSIPRKCPRTPKCAAASAGATDDTGRFLRTTQEQWAGADRERNQDPLRVSKKRHPFSSVVEGLIGAKKFVGAAAPPRQCRSGDRYAGALAAAPGMRGGAS
jgi:hypothetical protein